MIKIVAFGLLVAVAVGLPDRYFSKSSGNGYRQDSRESSIDLQRSFRASDSRESRRGQDSRESRNSFGPRGFDSRESRRSGSSRESFGFGGFDSREFSRGRKDSRESSRGRQDSREYSRGREDSRESYGYQQPEYSEEDRSYEFEYGVRHDDDYLHFGHREEKSEGEVEGYYYVLLPDTRIQHVKYTADDESGYVAEVTYEGSAEFDSHEQDRSYGGSGERNEYRGSSRDSGERNGYRGSFGGSGERNEYRGSSRDSGERNGYRGSSRGSGERNEYRGSSGRSEERYEKPEREYRQPEREYERPRQSYRVPEESRESFGPRY